jgi:hypothetical protein
MMLASLSATGRGGGTHRCRGTLPNAWAARVVLIQLAAAKLGRSLVEDDII